MGKHGHAFRIYKFRTMVVDAEERREQLLASNDTDGVLFKLRRDPRVTAIGPTCGAGLWMSSRSCSTCYLAICLWWDPGPLSPTRRRGMPIMSAAVLWSSRA